MHPMIRKFSTATVFTNVCIMMPKCFSLKRFNFRNAIKKDFVCILRPFCMFFLMKPHNCWDHKRCTSMLFIVNINTLWTGDADLRLYITTVEDGWRNSAFLTRVWFPRTINLITQYMEHISEWSCWRMFIETRVFDEYFLKISVHKSS